MFLCIQRLIHSLHTLNIKITILLSELNFTNLVGQDGKFKSCVDFYQSLIGITPNIINGFRNSGTNWKYLVNEATNNKFLHCFIKSQSVAVVLTNCD
jgi:hypothetical protein